MLNRKFPRILIITEAKMLIFLCKRSGFVHHELGDFVKMTHADENIIKTQKNSGLAN